jgi:opacity protein-like surface antigen
MSRLSNLFAASIAALAISASAAEVVGTYSPLGGSQWSLAFTVKNTAEAVPVHQFTVYFDESLFSGLAVTGSPATWDSIVIQPDSGLPAAGFFDALVLDSSGALGISEVETGFAVTFEYLGLGAPGSLPFDFLDEAFNVIASGRTTLVGEVPEPATWLLMAFALVAALSCRRFRSAPIRPQAGLLPTSVL